MVGTTFFFNKTVLLFFSIVTFISFPSVPQGAFSLVIEAWYSPEADQPGGEETRKNQSPLEGDIPFVTFTCILTLNRKVKKKRKEKVTSPHAVRRMWLFPSVLDGAVC